MIICDDDAGLYKSTHSLSRCLLFYCMPASGRLRCAGQCSLQRRADVPRRRQRRRRIQHTVQRQRHVPASSYSVLARGRQSGKQRSGVRQSVRPSVCPVVVIAVAATRAYGRLLSAIAKVHYSQTLTLTLTLTLTPAPTLTLTLTLTSAMIDVGWSGLTWRRRSSRSIGRRRGIQRQRHVPVPGRILVLPRPTVGRFNTLSVHRSLSSPVIRRATLPDSRPKYMSTIQRNVSRCMWFYRDVYAVSSTCRHDGLWTALSRDECKRQ